LERTNPQHLGCARRGCWACLAVVFQSQIQSARRRGGVVLGSGGFGFWGLSVLQQWTPASQTGRGDDFSASLDKFVAASPIVVAAVIEAYWLGAEGSGALSWGHHAVAALWSAFAITDFFATDITNQRLRARQFNVGDGAG